MGGDRLTGSPTEPRSDDGDPFGVLPAGTCIAKYEIIEVLGQGGFGITYRARDTQLGRDVAIKEYLPTSCAKRQGGLTVLPRAAKAAEDFQWGRERFLDEAKTLARLEDTPGIVGVHDFLEANGTAYMVMSLVRARRWKPAFSVTIAWHSRRSSSFSIRCSMAWNWSTPPVLCTGTSSRRTS